jgi:multisubunit Na+/H+ antiporter MnhC subunit
MTVLIGSLFLAFGVYFLLRNTTPGYVYGIITLGNGVNLLLFSIGGISSNSFPFIGRGESSLDPLPQALVLTAIVISFASLCFIISVVKKIAESEKQ